MPTFENAFFEYLNAVTRFIKIQPLNLGGAVGSGGGTGGPPGGFIGTLPQTRVSYDLSELASSGLPSDTSYSGASLLDNLNHIRYRLSTVEAGVLGITVMDDDVITASGITIVNFEDADVTYVAPNRVNVAMHLETADKFVPSGIYGEDLGPQIGASGGSHFFVTDQIYDESLRVYYNGVRQNKAFHTLDNNHYGFTTTYTTISGDTLVADYEILVNDSARVIFSGVTLAYLEANYYDMAAVDGMIAGKADLSHTHVEADITDLSYDAHSIQGVPVTTSGPAAFQALVYDGSAYTPMDISTSIKVINQQFIFTIEGLTSDAGTGIKPLRIYCHDINGTGTIDEIFCSLNTVASTDPVRINILKNGSSIFDPPQYVQIAVGDNTAVRDSSFSSTTLTKGDYFQIELVQVDVAASDLTIHIRFHWETS